MKNPKKYFEEEKVVRIMVQIIEAVIYIHSRKVIHRDIKP
jgi:serine/threonine protein kinase